MPEPCLGFFTSSAYILMDIYGHVRTLLRRNLEQLEVVAMLDTQEDSGSSPLPPTTCLNAYCFSPHKRSRQNRNQEVGWGCSETS